MRPFAWTPRRERAAELAAAGTHTEAEIGAELGVTKKAVELWRRHPDFQARVAVEVALIRDRVRSDGIAHKQNRLEALNGRWNALAAVIAERKAWAERAAAGDPELNKGEWTAPGAGTGLLVRTVRYLPGGVRVVEWAVDTGLLRELRDHERQAAIEMGQWREDGQRSNATVNIQIQPVDYRLAITALAPADFAAGPVGYLPAPGEDQSVGDGEAVGEDVPWRGDWPRDS